MKRCPFFYLQYTQLNPYLKLWDMFLRMGSSKSAPATLLCRCPGLSAVSVPRMRGWPWWSCWYGGTHQGEGPTCSLRPRCRERQWAEGGGVPGSAIRPNPPFEGTQNSKTGLIKSNKKKLARKTTALRKMSNKSMGT